jgi:hypothetical protein
VPWIKLDDQLHAHPKIRAAWREDPASVGLHLLALSYASAYLTDGRIDPDFVRQQMPRRAQRERAITALVDAGLWDANGTSWEIHDYLDYNEPREQIEARRRAKEARRRQNQLIALKRPR